MKLIYHVPTTTEHKFGFIVHYPRFIVNTFSEVTAIQAKSEIVVVSIDWVSEFVDDGFPLFSLYCNDLRTQLISVNLDLIITRRLRAS